MRRQYQDKRTKQYFYYIDSLFELRAYQRISNTLKLEILKMVTERSYYKTANHFGISKQAIFNIISALTSSVFSPLHFIKKRALTYLYVQADECYVSLQTHKHTDKKSNKMRLEEVTIHEGILPVCKGRNKLVNRTLFTRNINETPVTFYQRIKAWITTNYEYDHLYLYGDGATWITNCAKHLDATFILDLYHTKQAINRLSSDTSVRKAANTFVHTNRLQSFMSLYQSLQVLNYPLTKQSLQSYDYLVKHWDDIQFNFSLPKSIGCSQEGINFHYFASRITTTPKGWSEKNVRVIAGLLTLVHNHNTRQNLKNIFLPSDNTLLTKIKETDLGPDIPYTVIETLSDQHQFYKQGYLHLNHFRLH